MPVINAVSTIQKMGTYLCLAVDALEKAGIHGPFLDAANDICKGHLPDLSAISLTDGAKMAESAFEELQKIKAIMGSKL